VISVDYKIMQYSQDAELDGGSTHHIWCEVDIDQRVIRIPVVDEGPMVITITGVLPLLGHPKSDGCCR
jgi:hypothetical protein